jgi:hypothetical protein
MIQVNQSLGFHLLLYFQRYIIKVIIKYLQIFNFQQDFIFYK